MDIKFFNKNILDFIESLDYFYKADITKSLEFLESFGHKIDLPYSKSLGRGLFELRCVSSGARLFYVFKNNEAVVLHIIIKKQKRIPKKDLDLVKKRQKMFK
mgnify:CR=1 FL=1